MTTKIKIVIVFVILATVFAAGRYSVQAPKTVVTENTKINDQTQTDKNAHTVTTITTKKDTSGQETTTTTIVKDTTSSTKQSETVTDDKRVEITPVKRNTLNVSTLIGLDIGTIYRPVPIYGVQVTKEVLGPVTAGVFGLTSGTIGISLGLNF